VIVYQDFFMLLFCKDALNRSKVTVKTLLKKECFK